MSGRMNRWWCFPGGLVVVVSKGKTRKRYAVLFDAPGQAGMTKIDRRTAAALILEYRRRVRSEAGASRAGTKVAIGDPTC